MSKDDWTQEERVLYVYSQRELLEMRQQALDVVERREQHATAPTHGGRRGGWFWRAFRKKNVGKEDFDDDMRGLEPMTRTGKLLKAANVKYAIETVLTKQRENERFDFPEPKDQSLANLYKIVCASCRDAALARAEQDHLFLQPKVGANPIKNGAKAPKPVSWRQWQSSRALRYA
eukprot:CAMPEP_0116823398 /NCGR_PEP_ID=MMETSP0418-20121206/814_1 /TAXON_ID=1158023 /ORGANISM="Astrosyne radiata, Strain 13vi08-1A" /LENGTH=174 /DNA_ID=CAMNT_0004451643 /DNA_START=478 /DNA_END=1005 /DNA_ORIENTATION=-